MLYKVVLTFESVDEILKRDHSNEIPLGVVLHGTICFSELQNEILQLPCPKLTVVQ